MSLLQLKFLHLYNFFRNTFNLSFVLYRLPLLRYIFQHCTMLPVTNVFMAVNGRISVLFEQLIQSLLVDDFPFFFNLDFHYFIQNNQPLVHILIKMNRVNTLLFRFKMLSNMILPSTPRPSNFPFIMFYSLLPDNTLSQPLQCPFPSFHIAYVLWRFVGTAKQISIYAEGLHKHVRSLSSDFKCFVGCCSQYTIHSFFCSAVPKCVLDIFNNISLSLNSKIV